MYQGPNSTQTLVMLHIILPRLHELLQLSILVITAKRCFNLDSFSYTNFGVGRSNKVWNIYFTRPTKRTSPSILLLIIFEDAIPITLRTMLT